MALGSVEETTVQVNEVACDYDFMVSLLELNGLTVPTDQKLTMILRKNGSGNEVVFDKLLQSGYSLVMQFNVVTTDTVLEPSLRVQSIEKEFTDQEKIQLFDQLQALAKQQSKPSKSKITVKAKNIKPRVMVPKKKSK
jgi:hypothetical protein